MTDADKQQLAELGGYSAFRLLTSLFEEHERQLLADVSYAKSDGDALRATRRYQTFRYVREFLQAQPLDAEAALIEIKARQESWDKIPNTIDELLYSRYSREAEEGA